PNPPSSSGRSTSGAKGGGSGDPGLGLSTKLRRGGDHSETALAALLSRHGFPTLSARVARSRGRNDGEMEGSDATGCSCRPYHYPSSSGRSTSEAKGGGSG